MEDDAEGWAGKNTGGSLTMMPFAEVGMWGTRHLTLTARTSELQMYANALRMRMHACRPRLTTRRLPSAELVAARSQTQ
eukprot:4306556-Pleurochrysis_carterae.AAC.1